MEMMSVTEEPIDSPIPAMVLPVGLMLGLTADMFIGEGFVPGPGLSLWVALFGITACILAARKQSPQLGSIITWSVITIAASLMLVFRSLPIVTLAMVAVILTSAAMVIMELKGISIRRSLISDHIAAGIGAPLQAVGGAIPVLGTIDFREGVRHPRYLAILRGLLIALPLLLLFGSLFSQADLQFEALVSDVFSIFSPELPEHVFTILLFFWLATGMLAAIYQEPATEKPKSKSRFALGWEETLIIMGALVAMFLIFVVLQLPYLFGGRTTIEVTDGLWLSEYARQGFFELVVVSALSLGVLLVMARVSLAPRTFKSLAAALLVCVMLILASAVQRLLLYTQSFGLTIDRITAFTFMIWIAVCLVLFGLIILRDKTQGFAMGMTCSAVVIAFLFALANPAAMVIRVNTGDAFNAGRQTDFNYLASLGSEAVPILLEHFDLLDANTRCNLSHSWLQALDGENSGYSELHGVADWRTWNLVKSRAWNAVSEQEAMLVDLFDSECVLSIAGDRLRALALPPVR